MLNFASTFVNSLRNNEVLSPTPQKRNIQHTGCKGIAHGHGNYNPANPSESCPFQRSPSIRRNSKAAGETKRSANSSERVSESDSIESGQRTPKPSPFHRTSSLRGSRNMTLKKPPVPTPNPKTSSISSENFSESDSVDSSENKARSLEDALKKQNDISSRLFNSTTKASEAKTAKMRNLDVFDADEGSWMGGLRKNSEEINISIQKKKTLNGDKAGFDEPDHNLIRSRNGSIRRSGKLENGHNGQSPKVPPRNGIRKSFRKNKVKWVDYDEVAVMSAGRKCAGFFSASDKANCLKDLEAFVRKTENIEAKSEEHLEKEKQWLDAERIWLMHRGGFAAAKKEEGSNSEPGKVTIRLEQSGDVLVVDEDDIEKANPPQFDRAEDLAALRHLNESSVLHTLRQRYATNLIHTYAGCGTLLVVNPMAPLAIYSEKIVALFKGCKSEDMPPHIYSIAQSAYHNMLSSRRDQSLVFLGRSGSGKTSNFRHCVQYLVTAAGTVNNVLNLEKLTAMWTVLESFGNCRTVMNTNATRFTQIFSVDFDQSGVISSASIQILLLEKSRIAKKLEGETTFHIMHRLLCGVEGSLRKELFLDNLSGNENNLLMHLMQKHEDKQRAHQEFIKTCQALNALGVTEGEQKVIFSVLAAIFHLGCAGAVKAGNNNRYQFSNPQSAQRAASLLGTTAEELSRVIFGLSSGGMVTPNQPRAPFRTPSPTDKGLEREAVGLEAVEGIVMGLYSEVFNCVANLINRAISANTHTTTSILLVDAPGFQNPATCGRQTGASFEDLCHNYLQERLQLLFHHTNLVAPKDRYLQENIDFTYDENENENLINPLPLVNLLDRTAQNTVIRTSQTDLHEADRRGLLWLLDEESIYPGGSDDSFVDRLFTHYGDRDHQLLLRKAPGNNQFILQHLQGTNPVLYSAKGWLKQSRENPVSRAAVSILQESCREDISKLFVAIRGLGASSFSGSVVGLDGSQSLRRASSIRRTFTGGTAAIKMKSICLQTKFTIDGLIETLRRTKLRFVQCLLPQHNAGLCESNSSLISLKSTAGNSEDGLLNVPLLRSQIRGAQILDAVRLYKQGYPTFLPLSEFRRKFGILAGETKVSSPVIDERKAAEDMLAVMDLELSSYRVGLSQHFVKFPNTVQGFRLNNTRFYQVDHFPNVSGCIDCTHIKISNPGGNNAEVFRNRKGFFSLNVQRPKMASTQKPKYMGKPFIKKIYETHKKWLGGESKSQKQEKVQSKKVLPECGDVRSEQDQRSELDSIQSDKLRIVINSFDKILDEYSSITADSGVNQHYVTTVEVDPSKCDPPMSPPVPERHSLPPKVVPPPRRHSSAPKVPPKEPQYSTYKVTKPQLPPAVPEGPITTTNTKIPKLVKAKTCSIIESKCILKKTNSAQATASLQSGISTKTQSMTNLDSVKSTATIVPIAIEPLPSTTENKQKPSPEVPPKPSQQKTNIESPVKVKELVKRLNSLTEPSTPGVQTQVPPLSKAVSSTNLSLSKKHGSTSRIPVNSNLRKSFPSTPCHLDKIDSNGSVLSEKKQIGGMSKAKSVQNLAKSRLSLPSTSTSAAVSKAKSVQNLAKPRLSVVSKSIEQSDRSLGKSASASTVKPLNKLRNIRDSSENVNKTRTVASRNNAKPLETKAKPSSGLTAFKTSSIVKTTSTREASKTNLKPLLSTSKPKQSNNTKPSTDRTDGSVNTSKALAKKTEVFSSKLTLAEEADPKQAFVAIKGPRDKKVNTVVKKLEDHKGRDDVNLNIKVNRNQPIRKAETINNELKLSDKTFKNNDKAQNTIKLDLQRTKDFLEKIVSNEGATFCLDPEGFIDVKSTPSIIKSDKHLIDYNSDNSDDSGNISNEVDCDEVNSTSSSVRSRTSTESLSTVLDVSSNSKELSLESCAVVPSVLDEASKKIFFRTGVVSQLEAQRDERLAGVVVSLQAHCRGYLARRKLQQRKLQDLAVRCIQRNVRKFMLVRDWPWWRLLVRVTPLLNVHRTEEELRAKTEELEALKIKLQKIEAERTSLKNDNDKLEAKLSEMTADLAEEHSTATLAAERLDAETSERLRLEKELSETKHKNKELQQSSERLEMELLYARSDLNGICEEDEDAGEADGVYKQRYERALKELEFTKRRLQQQHEDDLEQLVGLKKQLEKKLADAYEEVEEQRQVVGTWKRKVQKLTGEMNDLKLLLEEQSSRNNLLEKKQRKYDSEASMLHDELKKEKQAKERLAREKEVMMAEKYSMDSTLADIRLELELKEEKLAALQREFDEITCGGKTEEEVTILRKQKIDCERRLQDQEEELDELAGQVQLLEQAKLRLEMTLESMRKESKKEAQIRDEELEEARCNAQKKVKALEQQLENEHEERTILLREKHELERRLQAAADADRQDRAGEEALLQRLKRDLKRTKALLRDTQAQLERQRAETPGKNMIRQLRNQLEDLECARAIALKAKQSLEQELSEMQSLLEDSHKQKADAEDRANALLREKSDIQTQLEENEEELAEVLKKYKAAVQQMSVDQMTLQEQVSLVSELEVERNHLKEQLAELTSRLESAESMGGASSNLLYKRSELKVKELESKLELEQTTRSRLEVQITRLKETVEKLQSDIAASRLKENQAQEQVRKLQRQLREVKEELNKSLAKESEVIIKKKELEKRCETLEAECSTTRTDLRIALKRIEDLQSAIQGELEDSISNESDSEEDSFGSDESVNTFLTNHRLASPVKSEKASISNDIRRLSSASRSSTSSNLGKDSSYA